MWCIRQLLYYNMLHWLHMPQTIISPVPGRMKHSSPPLKKCLTSLNPLFTLPQILYWFSNKIIACNLSFSSPLPCKHGGVANFHLARMYQFNIRIRVNNLPLMLMQYNISRHACWVLSRRCQLLYGPRVVKQWIAFKSIRAPFLNSSWSLAYRKWEQSVVCQCLKYIYCTTMHHPLTTGYRSHKGSKRAYCKSITKISLTLRSLSSAQWM